MRLQIQVLLVLVLLSAVNAKCNEKKFKTGSVCVCDVNSCDEIPALDLTQGLAALYSTSHSGRRLERETVFPTDDTPFATLHMTIDSSKKYQQIKGFGSAFTDASGANLKSLPDKLADTIIRQYFSPEGLGLNLGRVPIASNDFSTRVYSYDDVVGDYDLQNFSLANEDGQWKIPYIKKAMSYSNNNLKLIGTPWSAPGWMKSSKQMAGPGTLVGKEGDQYHKAYAKYFVRFLEEYAKQGIKFWGLTSQNEPTEGNDKKMKSQTTYFTAESQRDFIKNELGPALKASDVGKDIQLLILDDNRENLPKWAETVLKDKEAAKYVSGVAVHAYDDDKSKKHLEETHDKFGNIFLLGTEASSGWKEKDVKPEYGSWDRAEDYAADIITDLNHWMTGWMERNLVLDAQGGPSWASKFADAPIIAFPNVAQFYKQPIWYAIGHFSRFIQPGASRIDHSFNVIELEVESAAFLNPDGSKVIVLLNKGAITSHTVVIKDAHDTYNHYQISLPTRTIATLFIKGL